METRKSVTGREVWLLLSFELVALILIEQGISMMMDG